jgi:membrane-associated protein
LISLTSLHAGSPVSYAIAVVLPLLDAVFPALPAETAIVTLGVTTTGTSDVRIVLLVACAALGAFAGDNLGYFVGRRFGPAVARRFFSSPKGVRQRARAEHWLHRFGMTAIVACRFVPGGRTAVTLSCGLIGFPRRRFILATAAAAVIWAAYSFFLGRLGGHAFEQNPWAGLAVALGTTVVLAGLIEAARRIVTRRQPRRHDAPAPDHDADRNPPAGPRDLARADVQR